MVNRQYITFHYKNLLVTRYKTDNIDEILDLGNQLILQGLRTNKSLQEQIVIMKGYMEVFHYRRLNKMKVSSMDHTGFVGCFLGLMKLNKLFEDDDNGYIITKC
tara:strand:+ start:1069 stop:1380 length:312 start_codon:yes stop_codon:yes gene_type:complete